MTISTFLKKLSRKSWGILVSKTKYHKLYPYIYRSYWHFLTSKEKLTSEMSGYYSARPNPDAGIGHQLANWIAGYWFANQFGLKFAHIPFSTKKWDDFLGFGENEEKVSDLQNQGYKTILLPLFNEYNEREVKLIKSIINSYGNIKAIYIAEQDQFYQNQFGIINHIKQKFYDANDRKNNKLIYENTNFNIAIHLRRGDITTHQKAKSQNLLMRFQDNNYFHKVLNQVIKNIKPNKPIAIYLFSQGKRIQFSEFENYHNINFCLDWGEHDSFLHMVYADLLITSKSSFSYKPALLSNGIKICPENFWHGYPSSEGWILANDDATFDINLLEYNLKKKQNAK